MKHLGKYLLENGIVSVDQLEDALQSQVAFGGRLGTNLVELGHVSLEELGKHLSAHSGLPLAPREWLEAPQLAALQAVAVELVRRHKAIPLRIEDRTLHLAMIDPWDPAGVDEIAFATGLRVRPYVIPEATAYYWLDYHFDIPREIRHVDLSGRRPGEGEAEGGPGSTEPPALRLTAEAEALGIAPLALDEELVDEGAFSELQTRLFDARCAQPVGPAREAPQQAAIAGDTPPAAAEPAAPSAGAHAQHEDRRGGSEAGKPTQPQHADADAAAAPDAAGSAPAHGPSAFAALEAELAAAGDRDAVARAAARMAGHLVESAALFVVRAGTIEGLCGLGEELSRRTRSILLSSSAESVFAAAALSGEPVRTALPRDGIDGRMLGILGRAHARELAVLPIAIRGRVVNLLYADNGPDPLGPVALAALEGLCREIAAAYERLILLRKRRIG